MAGKKNAFSKISKKSSGMNFLTGVKDTKYTSNNTLSQSLNKLKVNQIISNISLYIETYAKK